MALNVISNYAANVAHRNLITADMAASSSLAKLSSGSRVVSAKDDAAALAIGSRLRTEVAALRQAGVNAGQAVSMLQIADGAMSKIQDIMVRMKTLSVQAGSGQLSATERGMLNTEYQSLLSEIDRIAQDTEFNGTQLLAAEPGTPGTTVVGGQENFDSGADVTSIGHTGFDPDTAVSGTLSYDETTQTFSFEWNGVTYSAQVSSANYETAAGASHGIVTGALTIDLTSAASTEKLTINVNDEFDVDEAIGDDVLTFSDSGLSDAATITGVSSVTQDGFDPAVASSGTLSYDETDYEFSFSWNGVTYTGSVDSSKLDGSNVATVEQTVTLTNADNSETLTINLNTDFDADTAITDDVLTIRDGAATTDFSFKIGSGTETYDNISIEVDAATTEALGIDGTDITTADNADTASEAISDAINTLNTARANIGASQNRLEFASANVASAIENAEAARSSLLDLDIASEMTVFTSKQILLQAGVSMLAQANQMPQNLLRLFQ